MTSQEQSDAIQADAKALVDGFFAEFGKALGPALKSIIDALLKAKAQAAQLPVWQNKCEKLKAEITRLTGELEQAQTRQKEMAAHPEVKAARLAAMKAQQERLAAQIKAEEAPPPEEKPAEEQAPEQSDTKEAENKDG